MYFVMAIKTPLYLIRFMMLLFLFVQRREADMLADETTRSSKTDNAEANPSGLAPAKRGELAVAKERVKTLSADNLALKLLLPTLLSRIGRLDPILGSAIQQAFQETNDQIEHMIASCRWTETRDRCTSALSSIRRLRAAVLTGLSSSPPSPARS